MSEAQWGGRRAGIALSSISPTSGQPASAPCNPPGRCPSWSHSVSSFAAQSRAMAIVATTMDKRRRHDSLVSILLPLSTQLIFAAACGLLALAPTSVDAHDEPDEPEHDVAVRTTAVRGVATSQAMQATIPGRRRLLPCHRSLGRPLASCRRGCAQAPPCFSAFSPSVCLHASDPTHPPPRASPQP